MSKKSYLKILEDILDSINKILKYIENLTFEDFENNEMVIDAVIRNLEILGEASKILPDNIKEKYSYIPWRKIITTRNKVIHEYGTVNLETVWEIANDELPLLKEQISMIYKKNEN